MCIDGVSYANPRSPHYQHAQLCSVFGYNGLGNSEEENRKSGKYIYDGNNSTTFEKVRNL